MESFNSWSPSHTVENLLNEIMARLLNPDRDYAIDSNIAAEMYSEPETYAKKAKEFVN